MSQPPEVSLAGTTTLDARLLEQLAVLLLRHALATLFDHGSHGQPLSLKLKAWCTQVTSEEHTSELQSPDLHSFPTRRSSDLSNLRCFFFAMRLRRFLITDPTVNLFR